MKDGPWIGPSIHPVPAPRAIRYRSRQFRPRSPALPTPDTTGLVILGRIGAAHGIRGELRLKSFTADPVAIAGYGPLLSVDGRTFEIASARLVGGTPDMLVVRLKGVADRTAAERLTGVELAIPRDRLPPPDDEEDFYYADLIGLAARLPDGTEVGRVHAVHDHGAGDILEIQPPSGPTVLLPFTKAAVPAVDVRGGSLTIAADAWEAATTPAEPEDGEAEDTA